MSAIRGCRSGALPGSVFSYAMDMLDCRFLPRPGRMTLLEGDREAVELLFRLLCVREVSGGGLAYWVDGAVSFDPHNMARMMHRAGYNPRILLDHIHVSRAFTAHQMCAILEEGLEEAMMKNGSGLVMLPWVSSTFLDEDLEATEAQYLIRGSLQYLREMSRNQNVAITLSAFMDKGRAKQRIYRSVREYSDDILTITMEDDTLSLQNSAGVVLCFPLSPGQTSFESFSGG